jgi:hypothetical protein
MNSSVLAIIVAGIPAAVAAVTFAVAQTSLAGARIRASRTNAVLDLLEALESVTSHLVRPWIVRIHTMPDLKVAYRAVRLVAYLPRRDRYLVDWLAKKCEELGVARGDDRAVIAAEMNGVMLVYLANPRRLRRRRKTTLT